MALLASFLLAFIPALIYAGIVFWLDRYEKEPKRLIFGSFIWGAVIAAGAAYILNTLFGVGIYLLTEDEFITEALTGSISAPLIEEILKGFAVLIVFLFFRHELHSILDGIVYAAITALGFAATENVLYMHQYGYLEEGWEGLWTVFFLRVVLNGWSHAAYSSFTGIGFAAARLSKNIAVKLIAPFAGLAVAIAVHFFHNTALVFVESLSGMAMVYLSDWMGWLVVIAIICWAIWRERKWIETHLKEEVASGLISHSQYHTALSPLQRTFEKINNLGKGKYQKTHHFYQLITTLAFKKQHLIHSGDEADEGMAVIAQLRKEIGDYTKSAE